jgi:hypothetical protein
MSYRHSTGMWVRCHAGATGVCFLLFHTIADATTCRKQSGPGMFEDVDCGELDCLVAQYELVRNYNC